MLNASALQSLTMGYNYGTISASGGGLVKPFRVAVHQHDRNNGRYLSINSKHGRACRSFQSYKYYVGRRLRDNQQRLLGDELAAVDHREDNFLESGQRQ